MAHSPFSEEGKHGNSVSTVVDLSARTGPGLDPLCCTCEGLGVDVHPLDGASFIHSQDEVHFFGTVGLGPGPGSEQKAG